MATVLQRLLIRYSGYGPQLKRNLCTIQKPTLLRDYIQRHLYDTETGYFSKHVKIGGDENQGIPKPIEFNKLFDKQDFDLMLKRVYKQGAGAWLTPMEIFHPWYGYAIADRIVERATTNGTHLPVALEIFEIGGGSGTGMMDILSRIKDKHPTLYKRTKYTSIEISERLAEAQRSRMAKSMIEGRRWEVIQTDFLKLDRLLPFSEETAFVLAFELLDNLPHDKIVFDREGQPWEAVILDIRSRPPPDTRRLKFVADFVMSFTTLERKCLESDKFYERFRPVSDPLVNKTIEYLERAEMRINEDMEKRGLMRRVLSVIGGGNLRYSKSGVLMPATAIAKRQGIAYLPTGHVQFLESLRRCIPKHNLILSDFDAFPGLVMKGAGGPAVQSIGASKRICDRSTYLLPNDISADIMFPTDFAALASIYEEIIGQPCRVLSAAEFFEKHKESIEHCSTMSRYCPLTEYFANTSYLTSTSAQTNN